MVGAINGERVGCLDSGSSTPMGHRIRFIISIRWCCIDKSGNWSYIVEETRSPSRIFSFQRMGIVSGNFLVHWERTCHLRRACHSDWTIWKKERKSRRVPLHCTEPERRRKVRLDDVSWSKIIPFRFRNTDNRKLSTFRVDNRWRFEYRSTRALTPIIALFDIRFPSAGKFHLKLRQTILFTPSALSYQSDGWLELNQTGHNKKNESARGPFFYFETPSSPTI